MSYIDDELQLKLNEANDQKDAYLLPENVRKGVTIFGVDGNYDAGIQTADATATPEDIRVGKTAYVNNEKITGVLVPIDTSDATATSSDILAPKTAYVDGIKVTGAIECAYETSSTSTDVISALNKSLSYNIGISEDGEYVADLRTLNSATTICIYKRVGASVELVASTTSYVPGTKNPDLKFSPIIENGIYRLAVSAGAYTSVFDFDSRTNTLTYLTQTYLSSYTSNSIYMICYTNCNKDIFTVLHTNLNDWGYGPVATTFKITENDGSYSYSTLWNQSVCRWQAGHSCFWNTDDTAFCYNSTHDDGSAAGYLLINESYGVISKNTVASRCCYIDVLKNHRIINNNLQVYKGTSWSTIGSLPTIPSDPDFVVFNATNELVFIGSSVTNVDKVYVYQVNWTSGYNKLLYTFSVPTNHMFFGSNNGSQVIGMIGFNKARTIVYNRKTTPSIASIGLSEDLKQIVLNNRTLISLDDLSNPAGTANVLSGKEYYDAGGLSIGTMANNGTLSYTPGDSAITIPSGYTSGGTVRAADITRLKEYNNCLVVSQKILDGDAFPYLKLNYVQSTGSQYLNTGIALLNNSNWKIELDIQPTAVNYDYNGIWGVASGSTTWECWINASAQCYSRYNGTKPSAVSMNTSRVTFTDYYNGSSLITYKNGSQVRSYNVSQSLTSSALYLFRCSGSSSKMKIYGAKLYKNNELIASYIPVLDNYGIPALYDEINNKLHYSASGTFESGGVS